MVATTSPIPVMAVPGVAAVKEVKRLRTVGRVVSVMMMFSGSMRTVPGVP